MKIKQINEINPSLSYIEQVLYNRNISKDDFFKFINMQYIIYDPILLKNIKEAAIMLTKHIKNNSNIDIIVDCDCDGYTSASELWIFLKKLCPTIKLRYIMHEGKQHGIILNDIPEDCNLLIVPDAGSSQVDECIALKNKGIDVIILDHHLFDFDENNPAIIVNSQDGSYPNTNLCGAGVVYQFCRYLDSLINTSYSDDTIDLVALGLIGDMMSLTSLETLTLVNKGLLNINNDLFKEIILKQDFSMKGETNPISIAFYVVPLINAAIRCGTQEEKAVIFEAFIDPNREVESTKRGAKGTTEKLKEQAVRNMVNAKSRQTKIVEQEREKIEQIIQDKKLLDNKILTITIDYDINRNITGLIANQIAAKYKRPTLLLIDSENEYAGSARNYKGSEIESFRDFIRDSELSCLAQGHHSAFGSGFEKDKLDKFINYSNEALKDVNYEDLYYVDFLFNNRCERGIVSELDRYKYMYGQELSEPIVGILNLTVSRSNCSIIGSKKDTAKIIDDNGIVYMFFRMSDDEKEMFEEILHKDRPTIMNIIGRCSVNEWMGRITEQLMVDGYEIIDKYVF